MAEEWRDIKGYEGVYKVSSLGRIKSLPRTVNRSDGYTRSVYEKILKGGLGGGGYLHVILCKDGVQKIHKIHQIVAVEFLNHTIRKHKSVVNHINFIKTDNRAVNLQVTSQRDNSNRKHIKSTSKHVGVSWRKDRKKWRAIIYINGKHKHLGLFEKEIDASNAYQAKLKEINNE